MKKILTILSILAASIQMSNAQSNSKYEEAMSKGMDLLIKSETSADFLSTSNQFERIANKENKDWLPKYYRAYTLLLAGIFEKENDAKDALFISALEQTNQADLLNPENSEIYTLKGYVQFMTMTVDPTNRAANAIPTAMASLAKARKLDPMNPRPDFVQGQNTFYTPEYFGGGAQLAKPYLTNAAQKFEIQKKTEAFAPSWGKDRCLMLLSECK